MSTQSGKVRNIIWLLVLIGGAASFGNALIRITIDRPRPIIAALMLLTSVTSLLAAFAFVAVIIPPSRIVRTRKSAAIALLVTAVSFSVSLGFLAANWSPQENATFHAVQKNEQTSTERQPSRQEPATTQLRVAGIIVNVGDLGDDIMPKLFPYKIATHTKADPDMAGSLAITHSYQIDGKVYEVEFRRRVDAGPYQVFAINTASDSPIYRTIRDAAQDSCRATVKDSLKALSSADFQRYADDYIEYTGGGTFLIQTKVDAMNSFGAKLRSTMECEVHCAPDQSCAVAKLEEK